MVFSWCFQGVFVIESVSLNAVLMVLYVDGAGLMVFYRIESLLFITVLMVLYVCETGLMVFTVSRVCHSPPF